MAPESLHAAPTAWPVCTTRSDAGLRRPDVWVTRAGISGAGEVDLLRGFGERAVAMGLPITGAQVLVDTLHPVHEGRAFVWRPGGDVEVLESGRTTEDEHLAARWRSSPFYCLEETGEVELRLTVGREAAGEPPILDELRASGNTGYLAFAHRFSDGAVFGKMDCVYSSWRTDAPGGFPDEAVDALRVVLPSLALAVKCASLARVAATLAETYLGRDAGRRVMRGAVSRRAVERIRAVIWYSDLRGYTRLADTIPPEQVIALLDDYAEAVISSVHEAGGEVLKLIGDGVLAIFEVAGPGTACRSALEAQDLARRRVVVLNRRRTGRGLAVTDLYVGLHIGDVFYGNIGSSDRLDFTVAGPAVNEAHRVAAMCRSTERHVLVSSAFVEAADPVDQTDLVSVGRYALRGIERSRELFTLETAMACG